MNGSDSLARLILVLAEPMEKYTAEGFVDDKVDRLYTTGNVDSATGGV